ILRLPCPYPRTVALPSAPARLLPRMLLASPHSPRPAPAPYTAMTESLTERREPETRASTPERREPETRAFVRARVPRVRRSRAPALPGTHDTTLLPSSVPLRVVLPSPPESSLPTSVDPLSDLARASSPTVTRFLATVVTDSMLSSLAAFALVAELVDFAAAYRLEYRASLVSDPGPACPTSVEGEVALGCDILEDRHEELECLAAAAPHLAPEGDLDALTHPHPALLQRGDLGVKRPPGSPPAFKARYIARGFSQRQGVDFFHTPKMTTLRVLLHVAAQRDYELHSLDFSTAFLQGCLHEAIWLRRPPGFTGLFPEALGFTPSTADPSLFLLTDTILPPFYVLVYVDDLVFATADTEALALVKGELQERHTCTDLGELRSYLGLQITWDRARRTITLTQSHMVHQVLQRFGFQLSSPKPTPLSTGHSLSAPPSDESVEPSGPYPELVGCLMYLMTCTRPDLTYPPSLLVRYVATGRHRKVHWDAAKRVLRYFCEGEIYAGAMAAQELRWLTYLLTDLGERHRSPPVLYVDNKAMLALCHEQRLEHRTKHIALRYFLARELQQRRQLRLSYVASRANTVGATLRFAFGLLSVCMHACVHGMPLGAVSTMAGPEERGGRFAGGSGEAQAQGQPRDSAMAPMQPSLGPPRDEPRVFGLDKFNGDNFAEWSFKMENIFDHYDLLEVMEGTEKRPENDPEKSPWVRKSAQGYLLLGQALGSSQIRHIKPFKREPKKGPKAWAALKGVHAPATAAVAVVLERQMAALRIEEDEAVEEGVQKFFDLLTRLEGADLNYSELQRKTNLLALLPESWSSLIINLNRDLPHLSLEDVKRAILQEDFHRR
ncbi:unnamed protein product, partial [Closterium sp. NIES-53]